MRRYTTINLLTATTLCAVGLSTRSASAETYQVGPTRDFTSLGDLADSLAPGDVVEIDGDTEYDGGVLFEAAGTAEQPIIIRGIRVNGNRPRLSGGNNTLEVGADHYVFEGLDLTGGTSRCFFHRADDITLRDSVIHDCPAHGILGADEGSGSLLLEYVEVHHCGSDTQRHQIYMTTDQNAHPGSVFRMQHCYVHDANGGNNVKSRAERNEIYCNWVEGALYHELELIGPDDGVGTGGLREDSDVVGNALVKTNSDSYVVRFGGDGTGETQGRYRFVNNTVLTQPDGPAVFRLFDGLESVEMHNNVFLGLDGGTVDLVRTAEAAWTEGRQIVGSYNWVGDDAANVPEEWTNTRTGSDPEFTDLDGWNLTPTEDSPLRNAGTEQTIEDWTYAVPSPWAIPNCSPPRRSVGNTPRSRQLTGEVDIGAYEAGSSEGETSDSGDTSSGGDTSEPSPGSSAGETSTNATPGDESSSSDSSGAQSSTNTTPGEESNGQTSINGGNSNTTDGQTSTNLTPCDRPGSSDGQTSTNTTPGDGPDTTENSGSNTTSTTAGECPTGALGETSAPDASDDEASSEGAAGSQSDGGCSCRTAPQDGNVASAWPLLAGLLTFARRAARRQRNSTHERQGHVQTVRRA